MVTSITLGNLSQQNGRNVITGSSSGGLDTEALLNSLAEARRLPAVQLEQRIEENAAKSGAYTQLRDILNRFRDAADFLRNPPGVQNDTENIFQYRTSSVISNTAIAGSNYLTVTAEPGATLADYDITVDQLATRNIKTTETFALADEDTQAVGGGGPFNAGTLTLGANSVDVVLEDGDTLNEVVAKVNAVSNNSGVEASLLKVADGQFRLSFITAETGSDQNYTITGFEYAQSGNEISIEAEDFSASVTRQNLTFQTLADAAASDGEYVEVPNASGDVTNVTLDPETNSAELVYDVNFDSPGTYFIHVLGRGDSSDDSLFVGLNGEVQAGSTDIRNFDAANFVFSSNAGGGVAQITVTEPGLQKLNVYMREDGLDIDKIVLSTDAGFVPAGAGPASTGTAVNTGIFNVGFAIEQNAQDAQITVNGTQVTRQNNGLSDVVDGLTFNLLQETPTGTTLDVEIEPDTEIVKTAVFNFVDAYNEFRIFNAQQSELADNGEPTADAVLIGDSSLRTVSSRIGAEIATIIDGIVAGDPSRLTDIGLSFNDFPGDEETPFTRNILNVDEAELDSALASDFAAFRRVFEFDFTTSDPNLQVFQRTNGLSVSDVSITIDQTNGIYQATYDDNGTPTTISLSAESLTNTDGVVLTGQSGTVLDGLTLIFSDAGDTTVNVNFSQGVGDRIFNTIESLLDEDEGLLDLEITSLDDSTERLEAEIRRIDEQVEAFRDQLLRRFSALEAAIAQANTLLQSLAAQADARAAS